MSRGTKVKIRVERNAPTILGAQADVKRYIHDRAEDALDVARQIAPITTGHYELSLLVEENVLLSTDPVAHLIEWGSINNRAYATLRNAAAEIADRIVED